MVEDDGFRPTSGSQVVRFPQSRVSPRGSGGGYTDLGLSDLAKSLGSPGRQGTGHWCSRCHGIWFGYVLEVTCPRCGSRHG
jgi:hypothetical protein